VTTDDGRDRPDEAARDDEESSPEGPQGDPWGPEDGEDASVEVSRQSAADELRSLASDEAGGSLPADGPEIPEIGEGAPEPAADDARVAGDEDLDDAGPLQPAEPVSPAGPSGRMESAWADVAAWFRQLRAALADRTWRHSPKESFRFSLVVAAALGVAYWFTNWPLPRLLRSHPDVDVYLVQPLIWAGLAALALHGWYRLEERPPVSKVLVGIAFLVGLFHVAVFVIAGVIWGFADSTVVGRGIDYPKNILYVTTLLAGIEASRAYLFQVWRKTGERLAFALTSAAFFVVAIPGGLWYVWDGLDRVPSIVAGEWAPALALSVLATFLVQYGGIGPSFGYRLALLGFFRLSPILPDLAWPVLLLVGVLIPVASASLVRGIYEDTVEGSERAEKESEHWDRWRRPKERPRRNWWGWGVTAVIVVLVAMFFAGAFGFRMVVVEGISMEPEYERGDLAMVREGVDVELLEVGDVILFDVDGRPVIHRIISIEDSRDGPVFTTQGDNVDSPDAPISANDVEGKVVFLIPEIGHVNLWLRGG
jgi:signal peptidase